MEHDHGPRVDTDAAEILVMQFLQARRDSGLRGPLDGDAGAARHFIEWLRIARIRVADVDQSVVGRFARHRCQCGRWRPTAHARAGYLNRVRRFVRFLEDCGHVDGVDTSDALSSHLPGFAAHLAAEGYSSVSRQGLLSEAEHFAAWLQISRHPLAGIDNATAAQFADHSCACPICRKRGRLRGPAGPARRQRGALHFLDYLRAMGVMPPVMVSAPSADSRVTAFCDWMERRRGLAKETLRRYAQEAGRWIDDLGDDPDAWDAALVRSIVLRQDAGRSSASVRMTVTVLRAYLRYRAATSSARPTLVNAVPSAPRRRLAGLPRYVPSDVIERIVASTVGDTPVAMRDRAIILLLARLGLRAGDLWALKLEDIDWAAGHLVVRGKGGRPTRMPLPQDAGDALLVYLERGRPCVTHPRVFLRVQPPYRPLSSSAEIAGIVSRVLDRGGIVGVPTGAHVFRHSLATAMLRAGSSLESVGTLLRHRQPATTAIYAKTDVPMLTRIAQPWPGDASC